MKINSENAKRQRTIAKRIKSGKPLVGLLAGFAIGAAMTGCEQPKRIAGGISCSAEPPAETNAVEEVDGPEETMGELPAEPGETNAVNEAGEGYVRGFS